MAILNGVEGQAYVESNQDLIQWSGRILLEPDPGNIRFFDIAGPAARGIYEGPVKVDGKFYFANGDVIVKKVKYNPGKLRVEFIGNGKLNLVHPLQKIPADFLV